MKHEIDTDRRITMMDSLNDLTNSWHESTTIELIGVLKSFVCELECELKEKLEGEREEERKRANPPSP